MNFDIMIILRDNSLLIYFMRIYLINYDYF